MTVQERFYTSADLLAMPDNDTRYEIHNGELLSMNPPALRHALVSSEIFGTLFIYNKTTNAGKVIGSDGGYLLYTDPETGHETVRVPDVSFISKARLTSLIDGLYPGAPDLAIEVISPGETCTTIREKLRDYFTYGTRAVWLIYTDIPSIEVFTGLDTATVFHLDGVLDGGEVLPGFTLSVRDLFAVLG